MAELINEKDSLNTGRKKLNNAIVNADEAKQKSNQAVDVSEQAKQIAQTAENKADNVQEQFNQVVIEGDSSVEAAQARVDAEGKSFHTLKARLDEKETQLSSQLAQTEKKIPNIANATSTLKILNPYGNYQNIHPKVLHFPDGLFGYKWWMAYTPYPGGNTRKENPCFAVSNNGIDWGLPDGVESGLLEDWNGVEGDYNNDTHLLVRYDLMRLEVWFRVAYADGGMELRRRVTYDGRNFEPTEVMFRGLRAGDDHICPTIIFEDGKYKMLSVNTVGSRRILNYSESLDTEGKVWGERKETIVDWGTLTPWHMDFINTGDKYEMVMQAWDVGETNNTSSLYYLESPDLITWTKPIKILSPSALPNVFDNTGIYRSSLVKVDRMYYLFYSALNDSNQRAMALSYGENILALKGFSIDIENLSQLTVRNGNLGVILEQHPDINNVLAVKQSSNNERHGGVKVGGIQFANGLVEGVAPEIGQIRYNAPQDRHERYDGTNWVDLSSDKIVFAEKASEQTLASNTMVIVNFESEKYNVGAFINSNTVKIPKGANYRFEVGLQLRGLAEGDEIELYVIRSGTTKLRTLARQKITPDSSGQFYVNASGILNLLENNEMSIGIIYHGTSAAKISGYSTQNYLFVERL